MRLDGKTAIITGGAQGIGKAVAEHFLAAGANVAIWDIDEETGQKTCTELAAKAQAENTKVAFFKVDTTKLNRAMAAAKEVVDMFGQVDILINNAGITRDASFKKMNPEQWQQVIDVNLSGVFNCTKAVYPYLEASGGGRIINAASVVAHNGNFGQTNYVASKAGLIGMTKTWAREMGRKGITVNAIAPGFINTEMIKTIPAEIVSGLKARTPLGRLGETVDIANAYLFLASKEAAFITGTVLKVDGGLIL